MSIKPPTSSGKCCNPKEENKDTLYQPLVNVITSLIKRKVKPNTVTVKEQTLVINVNIAEFLSKRVPVTLEDVPLHQFYQLHCLELVDSVLSTVNEETPINHVFIKEIIYNCWLYRQQVVRGTNSGVGSVINSPYVNEAVKTGYLGAIRKLN